MTEILQIKSDLSVKLDGDLSRVRDSLRTIEESIKSLTGRAGGGTGPNNNMYSASEPNNEFGRFQGSNRQQFGARSNNNNNSYSASGPNNNFAPAVDQSSFPGYGNKRRRGPSAVMGFNNQNNFNDDDDNVGHPPAYKRQVTLRQNFAEFPSDDFGGGAEMGGNQFYGGAGMGKSNRFGGGGDFGAGSMMFDDDKFFDAPFKPPGGLPSSVQVTLKESKSRDDAIAEIKETEKSDSRNRNRRMFGLLLGTLQKFKKEGENRSYKEQERRRKEIEQKLDDNKRREQVALRREKEKLLEKRRRQQNELRRLQRKKALVAASENQISQLIRLQNFIQTHAQPQIFFLPAKHTIRTIELQKKSQKRLEEVIKAKREETEQELKYIDEQKVAETDDEDEPATHEDVDAQVLDNKPDGNDDIHRERIKSNDNVVDDDKEDDDKTVGRDTLEKMIEDNVDASMHDDIVDD